MENALNLTILVIFSLALIILTLQTASAFIYAYYEPDYYYSSPHFSYYYDYDSGYGGFYLSLTDKKYYDGYYKRYYWDDVDLEWEEDPIQRWINKGDSWRERVKRARAVNWLIDSWNGRYDVVSGKTSEQAFSYTDGSTDRQAKSSSNFRYKEAYDPRVHGIDPKRNYYYNVEWDEQLGHFNWEY